MPLDGASSHGEELAVWHAIKHAHGLRLMFPIVDSIYQDFCVGVNPVSVKLPYLSLPATSSKHPTFVEKSDLGIQTYGTKIGWMNIPI